MKACKLYMNRKDFAEKLGISEDKLVIGQVENNLTEITITILIDDNADVEEAVDVGDGFNIRRKKY